MNAFTPADAPPLAASLSTPERSVAHRLTLLRAIPQERWKGRRFDGRYTPVLTKQFHIQGNAVLAREYDNALLFDAKRLSFGGIHDLHRLLLRIEGDAHACLIRGEALPDADLSGIRRMKEENGGLFREVPRHILSLDIDGTLPLPPSASVLDDPAGVAETIRDHVASFARELAGATAVVQLSSRAGLGELRDAEALVAGETGVQRDWNKVVREGVSAHLWLWLREPQDEAALKRWVDRVAEGGLRLDRKFVQAVQPLYTAAPQFVPPLRDPLVRRRTLLVPGEADEAKLEIPAPGAWHGWTREWSGGSAYAGLGYKARLARIGPDGLHDPILHSALAFVADNQPKPDRAAWKRDVRERLALAGQFGRSDADIAARGSDQHLDDIFKWCVGRHLGREQDRRMAAPPVVDAPPPPEALPIAEAGEKLGKVLREVMRDAAKASEAETKRRVWQAAVERGAALPEGFPEPPDPADVHRMAPPKPRLDAVKASTSTGKSHQVCLASGEMLEEPLAFPMIGLRFFAIAPSNKLAAQYKDKADAVLKPLGKRASHYRGWSAENPERPCEAMCPMHELRMELNSAGLNSASACKRTIEKPNGEKEAVWCARHPENPDLAEPPCGYLTQDLDGEFVVAAGGGTLTRPLPAALKRKIKLKLPPKEDGTSGGTKPVEIPAFDVLVMDENDKGQLFSTIDEDGDGDDVEEEGQALPRRGSLAPTELPTAFWPGMHETPLEEWRKDASEGDLLEQERCARLLRGVLLATAGREGMLSPREMRALGSDEDWGQAHRWIWHCKPQADIDIRPNTPPKEARRALAEQRRRFSLTRNVALLTRLIAIMVEKHPETEASTLVQNRDGRLVMQHPKELAAWMEGITTVMCDANDGTPGLGWWWPDRRLRADIVAEHAPAGVRCIVAHDTTASRLSTTPSKKGPDGKPKDPARDARALGHAENQAALVDVLAHLFDGNLLFTGPKWEVGEVSKRHAERVAGYKLAYGHERHFIWQGTERGLNDAENVWCALHDGRPLPPPGALENEASLLRDGLPTPEDQRGSYIKVPSFHRMRDGTARAAERYGHRDPDGFCQHSRQT